ncbi:hypothetical protein BJV74DRAFT_864200 [Russula compacta]|nr:hypothetical protein BJV74DRAFT_864200 [Russula compacta]
MAAQLLELQGEHVEVVQSTAVGKRSVISDAELDILLDRRKEVFEGRGVGWKSDAAGKDTKGDGINARAGTVRAGRGDADSGSFEVYEATAAEGNDGLAHARRGPRCMNCCHFCVRIAFCYPISVHYFPYFRVHSSFM